MTFHVGDRVHHPPKGDGTVVVIDDTPPEIGIRFDEYGIGGNTLGGRCEAGHGYWLSPYALQLIPREQPAIDPKEFLSLLSRKEDRP